MLFVGIGSTPSANPLRHARFVTFDIVRLGVVKRIFQNVRLVVRFVGSKNLASTYVREEIALKRIPMVAVGTRACGSLKSRHCVREQGLVPYTV
jgi:hypothetical protein